MCCLLILQVVQILLSEGADPDKALTADGTTPVTGLICAAFYLGFIGVRRSKKGVFIEVFQGWILGSLNSE